MGNGIVSVHAGIYGMGIYAIMLPSSGLSVAHCAHIVLRALLNNMARKSRRTLQNKVRIIVVSVQLIPFGKAFVAFNALFYSFLLHRPAMCSEKHALTF